MVQPKPEALLRGRDSFDEGGAISVVVKDRLPIMAAAEGVVAKPLRVLKSTGHASHEQFPPKLCCRIAQGAFGQCPTSRAMECRICSLIFVI